MPMGLEQVLINNGLVFADSGNIMAEQDNVQFVKGEYDAIKRGDIQSVLNGFADNIELFLSGHTNIARIVPFVGQHRGKEQAAQFYENLNKSQEPLEFDTHDFIAQGDKVVVLGHYKWRIKSNGQTFESDFAHLWTIHNGKATRFQEFTDTAALVAAYQASSST